MTLQQFIDKWNGRGIDFDNFYGDQCMDLMHQYHVEVFGITDGRTLAAPAAKDVYLNFDNIFNHDKFEKIANTPDGVPQPGDIILWGTGIGPYGHVAIFVSGDVNTFKSFDQNFPTGSKCHIQEHDYKGVLGWLRFKGTPLQESAELEQIAEQLRADRDRNWNMYIEQTELIKQKDERIKTLEEELANTQKERDEYIEANKTLNNKVSDLAEAIKKDAVEDADVHTKLLDAEHEKASLAKEAQEFFLALINLFYKKKAR